MQECRFELDACCGNDQQIYLSNSLLESEGIRLARLDCKMKQNIQILS